MSQPSSGASSADPRARALSRWFANSVPEKAAAFTGASPELEPVSGDASFRRYFRGHAASRTCILMDAPPALEDCRPFLRIAEVLKLNGVNVPEILAVDLEQGFVCLEDFGSTLYLQSLQQPEQVDGLYHRALEELLRIQAVPSVVISLPPYDEALLRRELELFRDWFCARLLGLSLSADDHRLLDSSFAFLVEAALSQAPVCVHRDYHSRNLMDCGEGPPGVLDFQDAVWGPASYDLVSLFKDCYIAWPRERVLGWVEDYHAMALAAGIPLTADANGFIRDFDLMGAQRHLKVLGIFSRLRLRDGKSGYLKDIPLTLDYLLALAALYPPLEPLLSWCHEHVVPVLEGCLARQKGEQA